MLKRANDVSGKQEKALEICSTLNGDIKAGPIGYNSITIEADSDQWITSLARLRPIRRNNPNHSTMKTAVRYLSLRCFLFNYFFLSFFFFFFFFLFFFFFFFWFWVFVICPIVRSIAPIARRKRDIFAWFDSFLELRDFFANWTAMVLHKKLKITPETNHFALV